MVAANQPESVSDLLTYLIQIVKANLDFDGHTWAAYDETFRRYVGGGFKEYYIDGQS